MAFVLEEVPMEDKLRLGGMNLWSALSIWHNENLEPKFWFYTWCIDRENDIVLIEGRTYREPPYETRFVFLWKGTPIEFDLSNEREFISNDIGKNMIWKIHKEKIPDELSDIRDDLIETLKKALQAYGNGVISPGYNHFSEIKFLF